MARNSQTNPDWSALIPVLPAHGPQRQGVYRALRDLIEGGQLAPGAKLPPTRDLAARLSVARGAVVAGYDMLIADGYAEARVGAGTFVAASVPNLRSGPPPVPRNIDLPPPLPGALGVAMPDPRSMKTLRGLINHHLARPAPVHFYYGDPAGSADLRAAVADYLRSARGVRCGPDDVILTNGTQHGLDLIIRALLAPQDAIWVEDPCYPKAHDAFTGAALRLTGVPVDAEGLDIAAGIAACPQARAVYVTPSHQFPLGVTMSMRRRLALIDWAKAAGAWVIEDDYDSEFRYSGAPLTALQGMDGAGRVIYVGTFSKVLFPGLRCGYLVVPPAARDQVLSLRARVDRQPATLTEQAMADLLAQGHFAAHIRRARRRAQAARDALVAGLAQAGLAVVPPDQGLHLHALLPWGRDDTALIAPIAARGMAARALSGMYLAAPPKQGLVIGFSGFEPETLQRAASGLRGLF